MVAESPIGPYVAELELWVQVVVYLLYDKAAGEGKYKAYSDLIVRRTDSPFFWTDEQIKSLNGTQIYERLQGYT